MTQKQNANPDMDAQMLGGCSIFVVSSLVTYGLAVWPFFVIPSLWQYQPLMMATGLGIAGTLIFTLIVGKLGVMAGGFGNLAGVAAGGVFVFLSLEHVVPLDALRLQVLTEWEGWAAYGIPLGWFLLILVVVVTQLLRSKT